MKTQQTLQRISRTTCSNQPNKAQHMKNQQTIWQDPDKQQNAQGEWLYKVKGKPVYANSFAEAEQKAKAQPDTARHSPLPTVESIIHDAENRIIDLRGCSRLNARTYLGINPPSVHWRNHADKLAEKLKQCLHTLPLHSRNPVIRQIITESWQTLSAYDRSAQ